jgi:L-ascorbate metabolism protein UlaG (beta-lactamase superfamily)
MVMSAADFRPPRAIAASPVMSALMAGAPAAAAGCQAVAMDLPGAAYVQLAAVSEPVGEVTIRFVGHATYLIETGGGVTIATDYNGWSGPVAVPDIVTMNHAHETHWTARPDPAIPHVFPGWNPEGGPAHHHEEIGDVLVRNVPTDIRGWGGGVEHDGNSIFIFEVGDLCIGHLGHLHHALTDSHYAAIGRLDVVMAAVDGGATVSLPVMISMLKRLRASVVLPMHYWGRGSLDVFLAGMAGDFRIIRAEVPSITLTPRTLPTTPSVYVLPEGG